MLNFRNTNIYFITLICILVVIDIFYFIPISIYLSILIIYTLIVFYGCYHINSQFFLKVICSVETVKKQIAISFDDGPAINFTPAILQVLNDYNVKAAFFCIGERINGNENILKRLHEDGHIIGNHSYSHHFWFDLFSSEKMLADLRQMDDSMVRVTGLKPKFFRPPYGVTNPNLRKAILKGNYIPIGWNVRTMDTIVKNNKKLFNNVFRSLKPGAIILFHDTSKTTLEMLPHFIQETIRNGYDIVRLDILLNLEAYA